VYRDRKKTTEVLINNGRFIRYRLYVYWVYCTPVLQSFGVMSLLSSRDIIRLHCMHRIDAAYRYRRRTFRGLCVGRTDEQRRTAEQIEMPSWVGKLRRAQGTMYRWKLGSTCGKGSFEGGH